MQVNWNNASQTEAMENVMKVVFNRFVKCESGATAIEYGLIASLICVAIIAAVKLTGTSLANTFGKVSAQLT